MKYALELFKFMHTPRFATTRITHTDVRDSSEFFVCVCNFYCVCVRGLSTCAVITTANRDCATAMVAWLWPDGELAIYDLTVTTTTQAQHKL